jgi:hypothetical protein
MPASKSIDGARLCRVCARLSGCGPAAVERPGRLSLSSYLLRLFNRSRPAIWNPARSGYDLQAHPLLYQRCAYGHGRQGTGRVIVARASRPWASRQMYSSTDTAPQVYKYDNHQSRRRCFTPANHLHSGYSCGDETEPRSRGFPAGLLDQSFYDWVTGGGALQGASASFTAAASSCLEANERSPLKRATERPGYRVKNCGVPHDLIVGCATFGQKERSNPSSTLIRFLLGFPAERSFAHYAFLSSSQVQPN